MTPLPDTTAHIAPNSAPAGARLSAIDQLRGVAILLVLVYHAGPLTWRLAPYHPDGWLAWPTLGARWLAVPLLHFGFTGVHCFFVLSGFCIHLSTARARAAGSPRALPSVKRFLLRRFWRIYPPYWIALALFAVAVPLASRALHLATDDPTPSLGDVALHATMLHTFTQETFFSINPAFWSLATEEQFYLAYPLAALALARFGAPRVLAASLLLSLAWRAAALALLPPTVENFLLWRVVVHGLFLPRWFEWLLGCALAEAVARGRLATARARPLALLGALLLAAGMASRVHVAVDKLASDALFSLGFALLTAAALAARIPTGFASLAGRALAAVGRRAYGLYLVHQPLIDWRLLPSLARAPLALLAGWLFSDLAERPFERRSKAAGRE